MASNTIINPKVHTACKNCMFAVYEDNTQTGCYINRLEKYSDVLECYDEEKTHSWITQDYKKEIKYW